MFWYDETRISVIKVVAILAPVFSVLASFFGLYFSYAFDFPAGSSIVAVFGILFIMCSLVKLLSPGETLPASDLES